MSPSKSFRFKNDEDKNYVTNVLNKIADLHKQDISVQGDALVILAKSFEEGIETIELRDIPSSVQGTLNQIKCDFIKYEIDRSKKDVEWGYYCYEDFGRKKKPTLIGSDDDNVLYRCNIFCEKSKRLFIDKEVQKQLRKVNIKKILDLREILINLTHDGSLAQIYICKANLLEEHEIIISVDGIHLRCPLEKDDSVSVIQHCYNQVDPTTMNPPCRYLIDPYINVKIEPPDEAKEIIKDLEKLEHKESENSIKQVDAEVIEPPEEDEEKEDEEND